MSVTESKPRDFWSRRRAAVAAEADAETQAREMETIAAEQAELEEKSDEEILAELNLPEPDTLKQGDDFTGFLSKAVPERIRRRALRKLWLSNPMLANVDGLVDYGEDFTDSALVVENLQTAYQVGKGMLSHVLALEEAEKAEDATEDAADGEIPVTLSEPPAEETPEETREEVSEGVETQTPVAAAMAPDRTPAPRRRMRFAFET